MNRNTIVLLGTTAANTVIRLGSTMILTRLLVPDAFALVGLTASLAFILSMLSDVGFGSFILKHKKGNQEDFLNNLWTIQALRGCALFILMAIFAYPISSFFAIEGLGLSLLIISPGFVIGGFRSLAPFVCERDNRPGKPMLTEFASGVGATVLIVVTTIIFESKWCIIVGQLYTPIIRTILSYTQFEQKPPKFVLDKAKSIEFWHWSKFIIPSSMLTIIIGQTDKFILSKLLSVELLGFYFIALNLVVSFDSLVTSYARRIIAPALAKLKHSSSANLTEELYKSKNTTLFLMSLVLGCVCGLANPIIYVIYDDRYQGVGIFLAILMIKPMLSILSYPLESLLVINGHIKVILYSNICRLAWMLIFTYPLFLKFGGLGVAVAFASIEASAVFYYFYTAAKDKCLMLRYELIYICFFLFGFAICYPMQSYIIDIVNIFHS